MRIVYSENVHTLVLPPQHRFPIGKYRMLYDRLRARHEPLFQAAAQAGWDDIGLIHERAYLTALRAGTLPTAAIRRLGFPWSETLVERSRWSVGGTLTALAWAMSTGAAGHLAGGTHHAFADRGEGYCVLNDIAVAVAVARRDHGVSRVAVVDLDVHQGNGTARVFQGDADVFTLSLHGGKNYPFRKERSSLDVPLADGCEDDDYLAALGPALEAVEGFRPEVIFYQAGVDALAGDRLGRLALTAHGLAKRDRQVFALAKRVGVPIVVTLGGGYQGDIETSVAAHAQVYETMVAMG
jgi:acetoin utilization deacetylase AcuC-like enzyme